MIKTIIFDIDNTMYSFKTGNQAGMAALCAYAKEQFGIAEGEFLDKFKKGKNWPRTGWGPTRRPYTTG